MNSRAGMLTKAYLTEVRTLLAQCSESRLREILLNLARNTAPKERPDFIKRLKVSPALGRVDGPDLIQLGKDVGEVLEAAQNLATEEPEWHVIDPDADDSLGSFVSIAEALPSLFDRVEAAFEHGEYDLVKTAYGKLFSIFEIENAYGHGVRPYDVQGVAFDDARSLYLQSTYLTASESMRVNEILEAIEASAELDLGRQRPSIHDLVRNHRTELPQFKEFLTSLIESLQSKQGGCYDAWTREAVILKGGRDGIEQLARTEGKNRPRAFFDWVTLLVKSGQILQALQAAEEALIAIPDEQPILAAIADQILNGCASLTDDRLEARWRWISFDSKPTLAKLIELFHSTSENERPSLMRRAAESVRITIERQDNETENEMTLNWERDNIGSSCSVHPTLLAHAYLLAGREHEAFELAKYAAPLGWSSSHNPQPLCVIYGLLSAGQLRPPNLPPNLRALWEQVSQVDWMSHAHSREDSEGDDERLKEKINRAYVTLLANRQLHPDLRDWSFRAVAQRVDAIVLNQYRGAYERAARLVGASCEALIAKGESAEARRFLQAIQQRYPRHTAFQSQLQALR